MKKQPIIDAAVVEAVVGAHCFFQDVNKVALWFRIENPNFGGVSPDFLIQCGRAKKVAQFVTAALDEGGTIGLKSRPQTKSRRIGNGPQGAGAP